MKVAIPILPINRIPQTTSASPLPPVTNRLRTKLERHQEINEMIVQKKIRTSVSQQFQPQKLGGRYAQRKREENIISAKLLGTRWSEDLNKQNDSDVKSDFAKLRMSEIEQSDSSLDFDIQELKEFDVDAFFE
ncbi:Hypothetical_protein [Hexamita inflata]|uniref:Hypothetical_protein n=1 Tax=Hexamita inflata TaxID=28002 RepID=A0AA86UJG3_9EUKA|nr:Hypothetical protein HINF_LOCUS41566 [Hexamita inflata]